MEERNYLILEILKESQALKMSVVEQGEIASTIRHYSVCHVSFPEIDKICQEVAGLLNRVTKKGFNEPGLVTSFTKAGQFLWDHLLSRPVKEKLKTTSIPGLVISMDEELISIPWELLYDGGNFLCLNFNLGRLVRTKEQAANFQYRSSTGALKMLVLANPTGDLKSAYQEGLNIRDQFDRKRHDVRIDFKSTQIDKLYVKKNLRDYDIVHFAGHCEYDKYNPKDNGWVLSDGKFNAHDILNLGLAASLPSLVFSNACHSAEVALTDMLDPHYQERNYNLACAFLFSGVRHYIGAVRRIEDPISLCFAREFYNQLISGKPVGEAMRLGRMRVIKEYGITNIAWASYLLYGDPNFVLFKSRQKYALPKVKKSAIAYRKRIVQISSAIASLLFIAVIFMGLRAINPAARMLFSRSRKLSLSGKNAEAIALSERVIRNDPLFLDAYPLLAEVYQRQGDSDKALKYYFDYAFYSEKKGDKKNLASAYISIGWFYHLQGEYPKATDFYQKALSLAQDNKDKLNEAIALRKLAVWNIDNQDHNKALELLTKSSEINRQRQQNPEHKYNLACDYFDIGLVFVEKNDYIAAQEFYQKSRSIFEKLKLKGEMSDYYFNLGEVYLFQKEYQKALENYFKGLKIDEETNNMMNMPGDYNMIGELYLEMDKLNEAEDYFNRSLAAAGRIKSQLDLAAAYYNLALLHKKTGGKGRAKAREFLRQAQEIYSRIDKKRYSQIKEEFLAFDN